MKVVFPRLDEVVALSLLAEYSHLTLDELSGRATLSHPRTSWYPTATKRVTHDVLQMLQYETRRIAYINGYPTLQRQRSPSLISFDQQVGPTIYSLMNIVPADAAHEGVWSFISLILAPDVAFWRYPNRLFRDDYERILGKPRNVFRRLWWRSHIFGIGPTAPSSLLLEDEAVGIMERPTIGGDPRLANAVARRHLAWVRDRPEIPRTELMRQVTRRIRRLSSVITFGMLDDKELASTLSEVFSSAAAAVTQRSESRDK
jgi:hypothetical protein